MQFLYCIFLCFISFQVIAQENITDALRPLLVDPSTLSGVGLKKIDFKDEPNRLFYQKQLYRGEEISVYVVSSDSRRNDIESFPFDEYIFMLHGQAVITPTRGTAQVFNAREHFFAPKGYRGTWEIRAGDYLHYELSVIASRRSEPASVDTTLTHVLLDPGILSGTHIMLDGVDEYTEVLAGGSELTCRLHAEKPGNYSYTENTGDQLMYILSGQMTLTDHDGEERIYHTGDFVIIPKAYAGERSSEGHTIVKYLSIQAT